MSTNAELLDACGTKLSAMDAHLGRATERMGVKDYPEAQKSISAAHALLGPAGAALAEVARGVLGPPATQPPALGRFIYPEPTQVIVADIAWGQSLRGFQADMTKITALKFVAQKSGLVTLGVAEYGSPPTNYQSAISATAGDLAGMSQGNQTSSSMNVVAGETYYFNFRAWSGDIGPSATYPVQGVVVEGAWA